MAKVLSSYPPPAAACRSATRAPFPALSWPGRESAAAVLRWFAEARRRRAAICELQRVSDGQLRDIGIARGEIEEVVDRLLARSRRIS